MPQFTVQLISRGLLHASLERLTKQLQEPLPQQDRLLAMSRLGIVHTYLGAPRNAVSVLLQAIAEAEAIGDKTRLIRLYTNLSSVYVELFDRPHQFEAAKSAFLLCDHETAPKDAVLAHLNYGSASLELGQYDSAQIVLRAGLDLALEGAFQDLAVRFANNLARLHLDREEGPQAREWALWSRDRGTGTVTRLNPLHVLMSVDLLESDWTAASSIGIQLLDETWDYFEYFSKNWLAWSADKFGVLLARTGHPAWARRLFERAHLYWGQVGAWDMRNKVQGYLAELPKTTHRWDTEACTLSEDLCKRLKWHMTMWDQFDTIECIYPEVRERCSLLGHYSTVVADALGWAPTDRVVLAHAARLCDIGLTALEPEALSQPNSGRYQLHPELAAKWVQDLPVPDGLGEVVRHHHEHWDGTGYPNGLVGEAIPLPSRLIRLVDCYLDVVMTDRQHSEAMAHLASLAGSVLDPDLVEAFHAIHVEQPVATAPN